MKSPDPLVPTAEAARTYLPRLVEGPIPAEEKEERFQPRYVALPADGEQRFGTRNIAWGVVLLLAASALLVLAIFLGGAKAALSLAICLATCTTLFVIARLQIFQQRNGGFLALAIVCLLGAIIPLVESSFNALDARAKGSAVATSAPSRAVDSEAPLLTQSFALGQPDLKTRHLKVLRDSRVLIDDKPFLIKAGDLFPLVEAGEHETTFAVRDLQVSLPSEVVRVIDPKAKPARAIAPAAAPADDKSPANNAAAPPAAATAKTAADASPQDTAAAVTMSAQKEAIRRYPALAISDSLENKVFISTYKQLKEAKNAEFFSNPEWPLELAELLAKREGWSREGRPITTSPAPAADAPDAAPADAANGPATSPVIGSDDASLLPPPNP